MLKPIVIQQLNFHQTNCPLTLAADSNCSSEIYLGNSSQNVPFLAVEIINENGTIISVNSKNTRFSFVVY